MAKPPLPDVSTVRVHLTGRDASNFQWGVRLYFSYSAGPPSGADCTTLAGAINSAFSAHLAALMVPNYELDEVDVLDIATDTGLSGQNTTVVAGTRTGIPVAYQVAFNVEYGIARRYRGGKPRSYFPFGADTDLADYSHWTTALHDLVLTGVTAFFNAIEATSIPGLGTLKHINLSYYQGYQPRTTGGGQTTFKPKYRTDFAKSDVVTSYIPRLELSSQRRRRTASTP